MLSDKEQELDTMLFRKLLRQHAKTLLICTAAGGLLALVVTLLIPKEYKSYGIVYPPSSTSIENTIEYPNFGYDVEADRLIQILGSTELRDSVVKRFHLASYYELDTNALSWRDELVKNFYKSMRFERMPSMSVIISARTKDPQLSADIVNFIIRYTDVLREKIYKKNVVAAYENAKEDYDQQKRRVDSMQVLLSDRLRQNNLSSLLMMLPDAQISIDLDKLSALGNTASNTSLGSDMITFKNMYEIFREYKTRYIKVRKTYSNAIPKLYVINYAEPNYKKVSPSYSVNVIGGALFTLLITVILLLSRRYRESD